MMWAGVTYISVAIIIVAFHMGFTYGCSKIRKEFDEIDNRLRNQGMNNARHEDS